jgi:hypothetical protein
MTVIPCTKNNALRKLILDYSETLKTEAHKLGERADTQEEAESLAKIKWTVKDASFAIVLYNCSEIREIKIDYPIQ